MLENFRIAKFLMQERQGIMIMKFYGRETERKKLNSMFQTDGQMISLIYGRRRIGKSELIRQVLKETELKSIYYECKQTTEQNNVDSLSELVGETFDFPKPIWRACFGSYFGHRKKSHLFLFWMNTRICVKMQKDWTVCCSL